MLKGIGMEISEISEFEINTGNLICHLIAKSTNYMFCLQSFEQGGCIQHS